MLVDLNSCLWILKVSLLKLRLPDQLYELLRAVFNRESLSDRIPAVLLFSDEIIRRGYAIVGHTILFLLFFRYLFGHASEGEFLDQLFKVEGIV